ncbi:hypothetical protein ACHAXT_006181 [Thalassiosira profunda]
MATADEVIASVDATLDGWRSAFESVPAKEDGGGEPSNDAKSLPAYQRRLITFSPDAYFAKPLELSPLVCAAFGWENTGKDIIKCSHPNCGATICVLFHPDLNADSHRDLCQKYQGMLASSHNPGCPFRSFARRWAKAMQQCSSRSEDGETTNNHADASIKENDPEHLMEQVSEGLSDTNPSNFYVPPYFLSLSDEFLQLEDCSGDGSITRDRVKEGALQLSAVLQARIGEGTAVDISLPDVVAAFCREMRPGADVDGVFRLKDSLKVPYLLSVFGWSLCDAFAGETGAIVKCSICQARARVDASSRKRRRIETGDDASSIKLIDSHRVYCPFVSGFRRGDTAGWQIVVCNLLKSAPN